MGLRGGGGGRACKNGSNRCKACNEELMFSFSSSVELEEVSDGGNTCSPSPPRMSFAHELFSNGRIRPLANFPSSYSAPSSPLQSTPNHDIHSHHHKPHTPTACSPSFRRWCSLSALKRALFHSDASSPKLSPSPSFAYYHHKPSTVALSTKKQKVPITNKTDKAPPLHCKKHPNLKNPDTISLGSKKLHNLTTHSNVLLSSNIHHEAHNSSTLVASPNSRQKKPSLRELLMLRKEECGQKVSCKEGKTIIQENYMKGNKSKVQSMQNCSEPSMYEHAREHSKFQRSNVDCVSSPAFSNASMSQPTSPLCSYHSSPKNNNNKRRKTLLPYRQVFFSCLGSNMEHSYYYNTYKESVYYP
ncbi:hypothetical protein GOP47_0007988 [Adiantum capillus-veneris]|uniref:Uncharacterized protein n=1 Tax=Adiantum capillus-veneris TaxID=13818 RepID=A0A9D4V1V0_ADICA|nr:hypothetical protein GOP47_0007988 [Adiantum capillus-veneris]